MTLSIGYRAVEEKWQPSRLLNFTIIAEKLGFDFVCTSDHFHPWFDKGGCAGQAWVWIAAAAAKTTRVRLGTGVTSPNFRYHPASIAQSFATLGEMFPDRIFLGLGTGEAMNEMPLGLSWPTFRERAERLEETIEIIKLLWKGDFVTFNGRFFSLRDARLYTLPPNTIPIYVAASGQKVAKMAGKCADAFMAFYTNSKLASELLNSVREGAKEARRSYEEMPKMIEIKISYDEDYEKALQSLSRWRSTLIPNILSKPIYDPRELDRLGETIDIKGLADYVFTDIDSIIKHMEGLAKLGFTELEVDSSSPDEEKFMKRFGKEALPHLRAM